MPPQPPLPPPGWYPDPGGGTGVRWWDGVRWTDHTEWSMPPAGTGGTRINAAAGSFELSGWWRRVGGFLLDDLIVGVPVFLIGLLVGFLFGVSHLVTVTSTTVGGQNHTTQLPLAMAIVLIVLGDAASYAYAYLFLRFKGQTVGMMAAGIACVDRTSGAGLGSRQVLVRVAALFALSGVWNMVGAIIGAGHPAHSTAASLSLLFRAVGGVGFLVTMLWPTGSALNQTLQDKAAGTMVIRTRF
jgi:uncharacterized RDD family membrane protein YckC